LSGVFSCQACFLVSGGWGFSWASEFGLHNGYQGITTPGFELHSTRSHHRAISLFVVVVFILSGILAGCSRNRYYTQADKEAKCLIAQKSSDPRWAIPRDFTIDLDPRSRYFDNCSQIFPPMPEDDPTSHRYMHCVDGMKGYPLWHANGDRKRLDNPNWRDRLGEVVDITDDGRIKLTIESTVRLAYIHSPEYQSQLETLYLSALDVSTERFGFATQFFGTNDTTYTNEGPLNSSGPSSTLQTDTAFWIERKFANAGTLVVGFANSIVWQFAGPEQFTNVSILNFNLTQPLLRAAGRAVALEELTLVERALLANIRSLQLFRQGFFAEIVVGGSSGSSLQRIGGFFGGTGMSGFTGTGSGGFGNVGGMYFNAGSSASTSGSGGGGGGGVAGGGAGNVGGFIGLLQFRQQIHNAEQQFQSRLRAQGLLEAHLKAGTVSLTQVDKLNQSIEAQRAILLRYHNNFASSVESYLISTLGLPPDLPVELDDSFIRQFQFVSPEISDLQNEFGNFLAQFGDEPREPEIESLRKWFRRLADLRGRLEQRSADVEEDLKNMEKRAPARMATMTPAERKRFVEETRRLYDSLADLRGRMKKAESTIARLEGQLTPTTRRQTADQLVHAVTEISGIADELSLIQARARSETITIQQENIKPEEALEIARANRLDWMNNRAALVNTWRWVQYNANKLRSDLSVSLSGDMSTVGNSPARFRSPTGTMSAGLQFKAPFARLVERNSFRQSIIDYQQQRRQMIQLEDSIQESLRQSLRSLELEKTELEIHRRAVAIAIRRLDQVRDIISQPPPTPKAGAAPDTQAKQLGPTTTDDLMSALLDLTQSQNDLMSVWMAYYSTRMALSRQMGVMQLDENGMWIDQPLSAAARAKADEAPLPPEVPEDLLKQIEQIPAPAAEQIEQPKGASLSAKGSKEQK
jgi:hypothetical protein